MNKSNIPFFSIIIPNFNRANLLKRAIQSVFDQTYKKWEIIIIDNYSTDETDQIVNSFDKKKINFVKNRNFGVIAVSRNKGIKLSKGNWIAFLDSDDWWYSNRLEIIADFILEEKLTTVISTDSLLINNKTKKNKILRFGPFCKNFYKTLLLQGNRLTTSATVVKKNFLIKNSLFFRENLNYITAEDYDFWMMLAKNNAKFKFIRSVQGVYYVHGQNTSEIQAKHRKRVFSVIQDHIFNIQKFSLNKTSLLKEAKIRLLIDNFITEFGKKNSIDLIFKLFKKFLRSPVATIRLAYLITSNKILLKFLRSQE